MITTPPQPLPSGRRGLDPEVVAESQRTRLVDAMIMLVSEVGYADVTIGAVTSRARTAKRTFYTYFEDREACFVAAYDRGSDLVFKVIGEAVAQHTEPYDRIHAAQSALLNCLAEHPEVAKVWLETAVAGPVAAEHRNQTLYTFADLYIALHRAVPSHEPPPEFPLTRERALSAVGAIELPMTVTLREQGPEALPSLVDEISYNVFTLVYGRPPTLNE